MEVIRKTVAGKVAGSQTFVLSDDTLDRMGDIIDPGGWDLKWFKQNPIALFGHDSKFPIGNWKNQRIEGRRLMADYQPAARGTSARVDEINSLIEQDVLRATSVGFVPKEYEPLDPKHPYGGQRYTKQELLEASIVTVPANPAALQLAKSLNISDETMSIVFGEQAETRRMEVAKPGEQAARTTRYRDLTSMTGTVTLHTSQRLVNAKASLSVAENRRDDLLAAATLDHDAIDAVNDEIETLERDVAVLERSETRLARNAAANAGVASPPINRRPLGFPQKEVKPLDLLVRRAVIFGVSRFGGMTVEKALDERYPGHEATALVCKAEAPLGTTGGSHFVDDLQQVSYQGFSDALDGRSIWPALQSRAGFSVNFDSSGTVYIPGVTAGGANGSFFAEGEPIRVGRITTRSANLEPRKMGVIIPFSREAARRSTPNLEALVRRRIVADSGAIIDSNLLDATAEDSVRPGGLLNGVSAAATGYGGGDFQAVIEDIAAIMAPFDSADASDGIVLVMHPAQRRRAAMMPGPDGTFGWAAPLLSEFTVVTSTRATAARLVAIRTEDLAAAMGTPEFEVSTQATIHMEDTTPLPIVDGSPADPVRSFYQTDSMGVRMVLDINWKMVRDGMVQWIDGTSW